MEKKEEKAEWELKFKKAQEEYTKEVNGELEKLTKLKTEDFQGGIIDHLRATHESITNNGEAIFSLLEFCGEERDKIINAVGKKNKQIDEDIATLFKRLCMVEGYLFCFILKFMGKVDKTLSFEAMQRVESDLSIDVDGIHRFCLSMGDGNGKDKMKSYINSIIKEAPCNRGHSIERRNNHGSK